MHSYRLRGKLAQDRVVFEFERPHFVLNIFVCFLSVVRVCTSIRACADRLLCLLPSWRHGVIVL